jgi:putative hydrolase of the HAD superfamily
MKSDILPPLQLGSWAIHVPYHTTWAHEEVSEDPVSSLFFRVEGIGQVPELIGI